MQTDLINLWYLPIDFFFKLYKQSSLQVNNIKNLLYNLLVVDVIAYRSQDNLLRYEQKTLIGCHFFSVAIALYSSFGEKPTIRAANEFFNNNH